jgi:hypothetical protein
MKSKENITIGKLCSNNSLLIINNKGIYRLFCPFKATCIQSVEMFVIGQEVVVFQVKMDSNYKIVYIIQNKGYYHHYFLITNMSPTTQTTFS